MTVYIGEDLWSFGRGRAQEMQLEHCVFALKEVYSTLCLVDCDKAFDRVNWKKLTYSLRRMDVN